MTEIDKVGVVGAGQMGGGIAEVCARSGCDVLVVEQNRIALESGRDRILGSLDRAVRSGKLSAAEREQAAWRLRFETDLGELADRQLVIEAVIEDSQVKTEILATVDKVLTDRAAIIASNTSSIPIMKLATATDRPGNVIGLHFFNPVPVLSLVEVVSSLTTGPRTRDRVETFVTKVLGKQTIRATDRPGFVVNALLVPYLLAAIRMVESGLYGRKTGRGFHAYPSRDGEK